MIVAELMEKYRQKGVRLELIPYSWEKTNGEKRIPFTFIPDDLKSLYGYMYEKHLMAKTVVKFEIGKTDKVYDLNQKGELIGSHLQKDIFLWLHDQEC